MYPLIRPFLFRLEPEQAHDFTLNLLRLVGALPPLQALLRWIYAAPPSPRTVFGLNFTNPVGLAAGYDKDGLGWRGLAYLGFGHVEIGTITPKPQPGNPRPRVFRLIEDQAVINRMGFPGEGGDFVARQIQLPRPKGLILGANLGKNKDTPLENAAEDYLALVKLFAPHADYLVVNVSSPNTAGLRRLQARAALDELLAAITVERREQERQLERRVPILVKLAPDLAEAELDDALQAIQDNGIDGVVATNTTTSRDGVRSKLAGETGGLSGAPLGEQSLQMIRKIVERTNASLPVVGVGGIMTPADAQARLDAGAALVQVYTGMIYQGPGLVKQILTELIKKAPG